MFLSPRAAAAETISDGGLDQVKIACDEDAFQAGGVAVFDSQFAPLEIFTGAGWRRAWMRRSGTPG
jgi:hypothetical protein